jgi:ERCC4-type nuclease
MEKIKLVCDTRERAIQDHINAEFRKPLVFAKSRGTLTCEVRQIDVGDYAILHGDNPLAIIERKSLKDYAASFKDGRHANRVKLLNFRLLTGCKIFYVVEGPLNPDYETEFAGIKYQNILASIQDLMIEYEIYIVRTLNGEHTAKELRMLCESYLRLLAKPDRLAAQQLSNTNGSIIQKTDQPNISDIFSADLADDNSVVDSQESQRQDGQWQYVHPLDSGDMIKLKDGCVIDRQDGHRQDGHRQKLTFDEALSKSVLTPQEKLERSRMMAWGSLPRVGAPTASKLAVEYSLADWVTGKITPESASAFTLNGRKNNTVTTLLGKKPSLEMQIGILSQAEGFSKKSAAEIVTQISLKDILTGKDGSHVRLGAKGTKLTKNKCDKIILFLSGVNTYNLGA